MKDDRLRVPVADEYVVALGRAAYVFAVLEWNAVWCCERLRTGYINGLKKKTAGDIANDLVRFVSRLSDTELREACVGPAKEFLRLKETRNGILHGKPGTSTDNEPQLSRDGVSWTPAMIDDAADEFAACSSLLNALLYDQLKQA